MSGPLYANEMGIPTSGRIDWSYDDMLMASTFVMFMTCDKWWEHKDKQNVVFG